MSHFIRLCILVILNTERALQISLMKARIPDKSQIIVSDNVI